MRTRQRILNYLGNVRDARTKEIARALNMAEPNIRHHLRILLHEHRIETKINVMSGTRGRPEKAYSLSQATLGDNLSTLVKVLLDEKKGSVNWDVIAQRLAENKTISDHPVGLRLSAMIERMNKMNYHAQWEAGSEGPRVIFRHCPYTEIIDGYPGLCRMDTQLLSIFLNMKIEQIGKIHEGQGRCVFLTK